MRRASAAALVLATATMGLATTGGCGEAADPWWVDALTPSGPCYRVDLADGLDTTSVAELHDLFACIDAQGTLRPLAPVDAAMDVETRTGDPSGVEVARVVDGLAHAGDAVDPFALAGVLVDALGATDAEGTRPFDPLVDLSLELAYGVPAADVRSGGIDLRDPAAIEAGVLSPLREVVPTLAVTLLDDDLAASVAVGAFLRGDETAAWVATAETLGSAPDPAVSEPFAALVPDLGELVLATRTPANDRWAGATGDSFRDLVDFFIVRDQPVLDDIAPSTHALLGDPAIREDLRAAVDALAEDDAVGESVLDGVPGALGWLASVDVDGTPLEPSEPSVLYRFARLLADNNHDVDCSIDLVVFTLDWSFDNLAVATLELLAGLEPGEAQDVVGLLADLTGSPLTEDLLDLAVDSGVCPSLTAQTVDDLRALEAIQAPEAEPVLIMLVEVLGAVDADVDHPSHLASVADLAEALFVAGGLEPAEELLRDVGGQDVSDAVALVRVLAHPERYALGGPTETLDDVLILVDGLVAPDPDSGMTGWQTLRPWLVPLFAADGTWAAAGRVAALAADPRSATHGIGAVIPAILALDPDRTVLATIGALLGDEAIAGPALRIAERSEVVDALLTSSAPSVGETPITFWARLVTGGALEDVLHLVDAVIGALSIG